MGGRINSKELDYFSLDVDFFDDIKIISLSKEDGSGEPAVLFYIKLLCWVYKDSYFLEWNVKNKKIFCALRGYTVAKAEEFLELLFEEGLLSKEVFLKYNILTSVGIQSRYIKIMVKLNRKYIDFLNEYFLLEFNELPENIRKKIRIKNIEGEQVIVPVKEKPKKINGHKKSTMQEKLDVAMEGHPMLNGHKKESKKTEPQDIDPDSNLTLWSEIVKLTKIEFDDLPSRIKNNITRGFYSSYCGLVEVINNEYPTLHVNNFPINWKQWAKFCDDQFKLEKHLRFNKDQIYGGLEKMGTNGIKPDADMFRNLVKYTKWFIDPKWDANTEFIMPYIKRNNNPNYVPMKSDARLYVKPPEKEDI